MKITTDFSIARKNSANRHYALEQIKQSDAALLGGLTIDEREEWIDDVILDWCDQLRDEIAQGVRGTS